MAIRLSGLNSGMDTDAIVEELVKAKSQKKITLEQDQKKLSWKQDSWKEINSKIYNLYSTTLSDMRLKSDYSKKMTKASSDAVTILTDSIAPEAVQTLKITNMAKAAYLTGAKLNSTGKVGATGLATELLGIKAGSKFTVTVNGKDTEIEISDTTTMAQIADAVKEAGVNCNFDSKNQRFYISAKETGEKGNFAIKAADADGMDALGKLGLLTDTSYNKDDVIAGRVEALKQEYKTAIANATKKHTDLTADYDAAVAAYAEKYGDDAETDPDVLQATVDEKSLALTTLQDELTVLQAQLDAATDPDEIDTLNASIEAKNAEIATAQLQLDVAKEQQTAFEDLVSKNDAKDAAAAELADAISLYDWENDADVLAKLNADATKGVDDIVKAYEKSKATFVKGEDASIVLNDVTYTSTGNNFEINGLTITLNHAYDEDITLTTTQDTSGVYDMIKKFMKDYNELVNEMDKLYNAESAKDYKMLTDEEKETMKDDEIEEWEKKIKSALLRKDSTLGNVSNAMKMVMASGVTMANGKKMYLSEFGINTLSYFSAADNEKGAYHIDGDPDDKTTSSADDKLKVAIANNPDEVAEFFSGLAKNLYDKLGGLMERTEFSSAFTVYNDKQMQTEYDQYKDKIKNQEKQIATWEDFYYSKFTRMEKAMAELNSKTSAIAGMFPSNQ
ncbi:MAG: flagellar filament capping protein FliD [Lachnospiraceae bacterium]|nr:flagellar filament capping protein FliD [Candidatus Colinaster equi]